MADRNALTTGGGYTAQSKFVNTNRILTEIFFSEISVFSVAEKSLAIPLDTLQNFRKC
jgi:hypothetical protein